MDGVGDVWGGRAQMGLAQGDALSHTLRFKILGITKSTDGASASVAVALVACDLGRYADERGVTTLII